jgi:hypothetical protein
MTETIKEQRGQPLSLDVLAQTEAYRSLTPKMQKWVSVYCAGYIATGTFDPHAAARAAYEGVAPATVRSIVRWHKRNPKIQKVVNVFLNSGQVPDFAYDLAEIQKHIDASEPGTVAAQRLIVLKARLKRELFVDNEDEDSEQEAPKAPTVSKPAADTRVPVGCRAIRKKGTGQVVAYLTPTGERVDLAEVEISQ